MQKDVIIFCNGWAMDKNSIANQILPQNTDIIELNSWHKFSFSHIPNLDSYNKKYLIAWSMGVFGASLFLDDVFDKRIAINGTEKSINNDFGIPERIFLLTLKNINEATKNTFLQKMDFSPKLDRSLESQIAELEFWWENKDKDIKTINWDISYISKNDNIIPAKNQIKFWESKGVSYKLLDMGHYVFSDRNFILDILK